MSDDQNIITILFWTTAGAVGLLGLVGLLLYFLAPVEYDDYWDEDDRDSF